MGDLFVDRFNSKSLASAYAAFNIFMAPFTMGMSNFFSYQVAQAMMVKPESEYTQRDRQKIADYQEYQQLKAQLEKGQVAVGQTERFRNLNEQSKRRELQSFISYLSPFPFFVGYSTVVGIYIVLGGLRAAAITDAVQGLLILVMSLMLIPVGLHRIGGFAGLHRIVPEVSVQRHINNQMAYDFGDHVRQPGADRRIASQHVHGRFSQRRKDGTVWNDFRGVHEAIGAHRVDAVRVDWIGCFERNIKNFRCE